MRQRVLITGDANTGKTAMLVQLALNNPDQPTFIFDTQDKVERVASIFGGVPDNVTVGFTPDAPSTLAFMNETVRPALQGKPSGYGIVGIDMAGELWVQVQEYMADIVAATSSGKKNSNGLGDPLADQRAAIIALGQDASAGGFDGFRGHWQTIRGWYNSVVKDLHFRLRPHLFVTTAGRVIRPTESGGRANPKADKEELQTVWSSFGLAPEGEKNLTFWADTCLGIDVSGSDKLKRFRLSILKDVTPPNDKGEVVPFTQTLDLDAGKHTPSAKPLIDYWKTYTDAVGYTAYKLGVSNG